MNEPKKITKKIAFWLIISFIIAGGYLRIHGLSSYSFWTDEFFHVFGAQGILETGKPILPSGELYSRSIIYTYIVAIFYKLFGINEFAARLPSVLFGIAIIPLIYYIASKLINRNAGLIAAFLTALAPFNILWARQCRMYTLFQFLYLLCAYCFFRAFENNADQFFSFKSVKKYAIFICIFILAFLTHEIGILFIPAALVYIFAMCVFICVKDGIRACLRSKYFKWTLIFGLVGAVVLFYKIYTGKIEMANLLSYNALKNYAGAANLNYYRDIIQNTYTFLWYIYPIALLMLIAQIPQTGLYLGSCFLIPFILLSLVFIFTWKGYRYMFFVFPFFLVVIAYAVENIFNYSSKFFDSTTAALDAYTRGRKNINILLKGIALLSLLYPILFPWIKTAPNAFADFGIYNFTEAASFIKRDIDKNDILISTEPFLIDYYAKRKPDFIILTKWFGGSTYDPTMVDSVSGKKVDLSCGIPLIESIGELNALKSTSKKIWLVSNKCFLQPIATKNEDILGYIKQNYEKHTISDSTFEVYYKE